MILLSILADNNKCPESGYNLIQSKIAIGSGGGIGKGFLNGTQTRFDFVPEQSTDFIFCTIGEEWGFLGSFVFILLFIDGIPVFVISVECGAQEKKEMEAIKPMLMNFIKLIFEII